MSYTFNFPCWNCEKMNECTDKDKVQDAVGKIHATRIEDGHMGSGEIVLMCSNCSARS